MTFSDVQNHFGGSYREIAQTLSVSISRLTDWKNNGIPLGRQAMIEIQTNGALKADLPSHHLAKTA